LEATASKLISAGRDVPLTAFKDFMALYIHVWNRDLDSLGLDLEFSSFRRVF
jgi:hypothetical protein